MCDQMLFHVACSGMLICCCQVFTVLMMVVYMVAVIGKFQIESHCQISDHLVNRFKLFNQISNPMFSQISNLLVKNLRSFCFKLDTFIHRFFYVKNNVYMYSRLMITVSYYNTVSPSLRFELHAKQQ